VAAVAITLLLAETGLQAVVLGQVQLLLNRAAQGRKAITVALIHLPQTHFILVVAAAQGLSVEVR
jgi:hypothetical protein